MSTVKKILVVDDDPGIQFMIRRLLEKKGYEVILASSGNECLKTVVSAPPDLIVLDVAMPALGGIGALEKLKRNGNWCQIPVILISGDPSHEKTQTVSRLGGDDFIAKPFKSDDLVSRVSKHLMHLDYAALKQILFQLRNRDSALSALAGFAANHPWDVFTGNYQGLPILTLVPIGFESKDVRQYNEALASQKIQVLANMGFSWKRLWPHHSVKVVMEEIKKVG